MSTAEEYRFRCAECAESIVVNDSMREALLEFGCIICGTPPTPSSFSLA